MKIDRDLEVHICNACRASLADIDFIRCGISTLRNQQFFFDYHCPRCNHRGRYVIDVPPNTGISAALSALAKLVTDGEAHTPRVDWDSMVWE